MASLLVVGREGKNAAPEGRRGHGALMGLVLGSVLLAAGLLAGGFEAERILVLQPYNIDATGSARYLYEIAAPTFPFAFAKEKVEGGQEPRLAVKEDGSPLGPRLGVEYRAVIAVEGEIGELGKGRHALERGVLHFSASDNSDPRANGRFYHLAYAIAVAPAARLLLVGAGLALLFKAWRNAAAGRRRAALTCEAGSPHGLPAPISARDESMRDQRR